ncbi:hypothetical protein [Capillimicrobium parvum]|uniref:Uncharacterized protein n=1 Tax=Capillimicrobium parvum TaxID=2884022 RepID=A0A9E6XVK7_9ACTN|nr:hypothetical protein [Capillimicrobium parvum]UGS35270.1 hypothetical protein DSM104329_01657 [Capillimicrobium parvum]
MFPSFFHHATRSYHPADPARRRARGDDLGQPVTIRVSELREPALERLAALDGAPLPAGPRLIAEIGGRPIAAVGLRGGEAVADPFERSAPFVELLRVRAGQLAR